MVRLSGPQLRARAAAIRLVVSDVDGVLTDAGVYYSAAGEELKRFSMRDGMGVELLRERGIRTALMTREDSPNLGALQFVAEAGLAVCPADAAAKVAAAVHFVTAARGGHGAFRELCDLILENQKEHTA